MTDPVLPAPPAAGPGRSSVEYRRLLGLVEQAVDASLSESTKVAYRSGWAHWVKFCAVWQLPLMPVTPESLAAFLVDRADQKIGGQPRWKASTLDMWVAAIVYTNGVNGHPDPSKHETFRKARQGIRRQLTTRPTRKRPLTVEQITTMIGVMDFHGWPTGVAAARDAALLLFGIAGIGRRAELAALNIGDLTPTGEGLHVLIRRSKTDQSGEGMVKFLPIGQHVSTCAPCAVWHWLRLVAIADAHAARRAVLATTNGGDPRAAAVQQSADLMRQVYAHSRDQHICHAPPTALADNPRPLFRSVTRQAVIATAAPAGCPGSPAGDPAGDRARLSGHGVNFIVRQRLAAAGIDPAGYGSHSLRAGFVTEALRAGATTRQVMRQTGHTSEATVAVYDREHNPGRDNAVTEIGL